MTNPQLSSLNPKPTYYNDILIFSSRGPAWIGDAFGTPNLPLSYLQAARHVIEGALETGRLSEVALPAAYLQRHAVELKLKDIIRTARGIAQDELWCTLLAKDGQAKAPPFDEPSGHPLQELIAEAEAALGAIDFDILPDPLKQMCLKLTDLEKRDVAGKPDATRMRYLRDRAGKEHFPELQLLPLVEHQNELEAVFDELVHKEDQVETKDQNWGTRLAWRADFAMRDVE